MPRNPAPKRDQVQTFKAKIAELETVVAEKDDFIRARDESLASALERVNQESQRADSSERYAKDTREQFSDLKERIANLERQNAEMRGYIDRAQEDDVVREDLVKIGDPDGDVTLVPKRKHRQFPVLHGGQTTVINYDEAMCRTVRREQVRRPKHWVNY